ncbi:MAG: carboxy terminal-processing peptidase [Kiritimatiellae bacterium]|nr:carboxy terminal-processing peptidase [Kiritimatiellia bacterium]
MKKLFSILALLPLFSPAADLRPQPYYGKVAAMVGAQLQRAHVLQRRLDAEMSERAWSNLVTQCDFNHMVFLQEDLDRFAPMKTKIGAALKDKDVSFGYDVWKTFTERFRERVDFVTNLLEAAEFDFSVDEDWTWQRKDAPWPATREEQDELWRRRVKNEYLLIVLGRELDAEKAAADELEAAKKKDAKRKDAKGAETNDAETVKGPPQPPKEVLEKRYRQYLEVLTENDEEMPMQRYMSAVAQAFDPHSDYMCPTRKEDFDMDMNLTLCGVGAVLQMDDGALKIVEVMPGGPMARDGRIKKDDKIVGVGQGDGPVEDVMYKPMRKTIRKIRGPKGTKVVLEIIPRSDPSGETRKRVPLVRDEIKLEDHAATGRVERVACGGVTNLFGYVKLPGFYGTMDKRPGDEGYRSCSLDVAEYVSKFNTKGTAGMILDLRGNGGGSLKEAVLLSQLFIRPSPVVQIRETRNLYVLPTFPDQPCLAYRKPLVVMVDRASASASEIVAAALQDTGRAIVVGDRQSHGKGTVQTVFPLGAEKYGSMKVTTARFYRVNGSSTQVKGVSSDVDLPSVLEELDIGEDKLPNALPWTCVGAVHHPQMGDVRKLVPQLKALSEARREKDPAWRAHMKKVAHFRDSSKRTSVPLHRGKRLAQLREDREMDAEAEPAGELDDELPPDPEDDAPDSAEDGKDDVVLQEAFQVLGDLSRLCGDDEIQEEQEERKPAWLQLLGGE